MMKNGPPTTLMMIDADTSYGAAMVLPMVSASKNVNAPNKALNGTNAFLPEFFRYVEQSVLKN